MPNDYAELKYRHHPPRHPTVRKANVFDDVGRTQEARKSQGQFASDSVDRICAELKLDGNEARAAHDLSKAFAKQGYRTGVASNWLHEHFGLARGEMGIPEARVASAILSGLLALESDHSAR